MSFTANLKLPLMPDTPQEGVTGLDLRKMINGENEDSMAQILDKIIEPNTNKATAVDNETMPDDDNKFPTCALVNKVLSNIGGNTSVERTVILEEQEISGFSEGVTRFEGILPIVAGETHIVSWDGTDYECVAFEENIMGNTLSYLGNAGLDGREDTGEPFLFGTAPHEITGEGDVTIIMAADMIKDSHTIAIYKESIVNYLTTEDKEELVKLILDNELFSNNEMTFTHLSTIDRYTWHQIGSSAINFIPGETYYVEWDGKFYKCIAGSGSMGGNTWNGIGNATLVGIGEDTGEPFGFVYNLEVPQNMFVSNDTEETTHSVKIYQKLANNSIEQVQSDWDEKDTSSPAYIKNKPVISAGGGASVQANWEQTDETQADFIKNKPFYEYENLVEVFPLTQCDNFTLNEQFNLYAYDTISLEKFVVGETYIITWDGVDYECIAQDTSSIIQDTVGLGNGTIFGIPSNNEPFIIVFARGYYLSFVALTDTEASGSHTVHIRKKEYLVKSLDKKYSPILNYKKERMNEILPLRNLTSFELDSRFDAYTKGDVSYLYSLKAGETYIVNWDGIEYECVAQDANEMQENGIALGNASAWGLSGNNEPFVIAVINYKGAMYGALTDTEAGGSHTVRIYQYENETCILDNKYLSFMNCESKDIELLPLTQYDGFLFMSDYGAYSKEVMGSDLYSLTLGETYVITWDGIDYECVAQDASSLLGMPGMIGVGNGTSWGLSGNNEPFAFITIPGIGAQYFSLTDTEDGGSHTIRIMQYGVVTEKIDKEYLPIPFFGEVDSEILIDGTYEFDVENDGFAFIPKTSNTYLVEGQEYVMVYNGVEYTSVAISAENMMGMVAIGDVDLILNGTSNGIPFVIIDDRYGAFAGGTPMFICLPTSDSILSLTFDLKVISGGIVKIEDKYIPQSNWNENDKSSAAYIKNKPFGVIPKGTVIMDIIANCNNTAGDGLHFAYINKIDIGNYSYNFEINGTLYGGVTNVFSNGDIKISFGDKTGDIYFEIYKENSQSESDIIYYFASKTYGEHSVKLILNEDIYQTIDPKFIPGNSGLPEVSTNDNGKTLLVSEGVWTVAEPPKGVPEVTSEDAGKFLRVGSNGTWIVEAIQDVSEVGL